MVLRNAHRTDRTADAQFSSTPNSSIDSATDSEARTTDQLLAQLADGTESCRLLCATVELTHFDPSQHRLLLPLLWQYILDHRNSNDRDTLLSP